MAAGAERRDLSTAPLGELLAHGVTCDEQEPVLGVFEGVRADLSLLAAMAIDASPTAVIALAELGPALEGSVRRLEVGIELLRRLRAPAPATLDGPQPSH